MSNRCAHCDEYGVALYPAFGKQLCASCTNTQLGVSIASNALACDQRDRLINLRKPLLDFCREVVAKEEEVGLSTEATLAFLAEKARSFLGEEK